MATRKKEGTVKSKTLESIDYARQEFGNIMIGVENGETPEQSDKALLDLYTQLTGATDTDWVEESTKGNRGALMQATLAYQKGVNKLKGVDRVDQKWGTLLDKFEEDVESLHSGFMSEKLIGRVVKESGMKPLDEMVNMAKGQSYDLQVKKILQTPELRKAFGLSDYKE
jgi:hypothetical protein